jgi:predicted phosphodiesterase
MLRSSVTVMVSGHSHERLVRTLGPLTIVNAGTLHRDDAPGFCLLDLEGRTVDYFDIDSSGGIRPGPSFTFGRAGQDLWDAGF